MSYKKPIFEGVPEKRVNKSYFDLSHEWKCQYVPGYIQPIFLQETLPGDEWKINSEFLFRFAPMYFPLMHKITMRTNYFYIPNRILWPGDNNVNVGWTSWIAELNDVSHPYCTPSNLITDTGGSGDTFNYTLASKFGLPELEGTPPFTGLETSYGPINAFPFSAYLKIWDEYYRIPQLEDPRWFPLETGDNTSFFDDAFGTNTLHRWAMFSSKWEQDYFTAALPTPQIGDAIQMPAYGPNVINANTGGPPTGGAVSIDNVTATEGQLVDSVGNQIEIEGATIRELRLAEVLQSYYERIMKVGQRYRDFIKGLWGNDPQPGLIDRPVLIGSKFGRVQITDVLTQADTVYSAGGNNRQTGDYTGSGSLYSMDQEYMEYYCQEHGFIIGLMEMNPNTGYGQGIHRIWRKAVQTDYALDMFASIGDQEIKKEEVFWNFTTAAAAENDDTFGYIPRFSEYRYANSVYVAEMNRGSGLSMHLGRWWDPVEQDTNGANLVISGAFTNVAVDGPTATSGNDEDYFGHMRTVDGFRVYPITFNNEGTKISAAGTVYCHIYHTAHVLRNLPFYSVPDLT